jgi:hypothetical protein
LIKPFLTIGSGKPSAISYHHSGCPYGYSGKIARLFTVDYDPDVEYADGALVERNVGDWPHSLTQSNLIFSLRSKYPPLFAVPDAFPSGGRAHLREPSVSSAPPW